MKKQDDFNFNGFEPANTTPVPDVLFDELLSYLTGAELKVLLYIIRRTRGFKKETDAISLTQFQKGITTKDGKQLDKGCGIDDRQTIINALASLEKKNCIVSEKGKTPIGDNAVTVYRICFRQAVVGNSNHLVGNADYGSRENPTRVVDFSDQGSRENHTTVVGNSNPQETVLQDTDKQQTEIQEESTGGQMDTTTSAPSLPLDAALSSSDNPITEGEPHVDHSDHLFSGGNHLAVSHRMASQTLVTTDSSPQSEIETQSQQQEIARACDTCGRPQTQADCPWCMTTRLPAIPKQQTEIAIAEAASRGDCLPTVGKQTPSLPRSPKLTDGEHPPCSVPASTRTAEREPRLTPSQPGVNSGRTDRTTDIFLLDGTKAEANTSLPSAVEPGRSGGPTPVAPVVGGQGEPTTHHIAQVGDMQEDDEQVSHEQNRDASPRNVAVESDLGAVASAPIPPALPEVSPPRTMRATVVSPPPQVLVVSQQFTSAEQWKEAQEAFVEQLRGIWKTASPDFKRQAGNWNAYRKQYLDRWLKANPQPTAESLLSPEERRIWQDWQTNYKRPIPLTASDKQALVMLLPINPTREELKTVRGWLFSTDDPKKPWYRKIGVSLLDCAKNWSKWQSLQEPERGEKPATRTLTHEELRRMPV